MISTAPVIHAVPPITEPNVSQIPYTKTPPIIPYAWNMLTIEGSVPTAASGVENSAFYLNIDTSPSFSITMQGNFDLNYRHYIQRMKDILDIRVKNTYSFTDTSIAAGFTFDILYKNWLFDIQNSIPFFAQVGITPNITPPNFTTSPPLPTTTVETLELSWANSAFDMTARIQPFIGVGIGRMHHITHHIAARIILRSLGLSTSDENVHAAASILTKEDQYMHAMSADFSQNYRRYYNDLLDALDLEGRHLDLLSLEESQVYGFEHDKFALSRWWFSSDDMDVGGEVGLSIAPMITIPTTPTSPLPVADALDFTLTLHEKFSRITLQDRLYVKLEAEQSLMQYNTAWLKVMIGAELRYYPRFSRLWFAFGIQDTVQLDIKNNSISNAQQLDLSAHYLIAPNFMVFGQLDTNFIQYELNIGGKIRIM